MSNLVPNEWRRVQLGDVVEPRSSNVDKKTHEGEIPVQLCNYTDVYYNNRITSRVSFMDATAKEREIERFTLAVDDVIITKDSETPNDIAVPAYVSEDLRGVVCGYHLTILRPYQGKSNGEYLAHLFQLPSIQHHFYVLANGITRFGLTADAISNAPLVLPPLSEQKKIAAILTSVDEVIEKTQAQIDKLKDLKTGMMQELLTCGVGVDGKPHMEFKDSPVGRIPKAWEVKSIGDLFQVQLGKMLSKQSKVGDCPLPYLSKAHEDKTVNLVTTKRKLTALGCAVQTGRLDVVKTVVDLGAMVDQRHDIGAETPLFTCLGLIIHHKRPSIPSMLAESNRYSDQNLQSYMAHAAGLVPHDKEQLKKVIASNQETSIFSTCEDFGREYIGRNICDLTTIDGLREIAKYLIEKGANPNAKHDTALHGYTPLMLAAELDEAELFYLMAKAGGDINDSCVNPQNNQRKSCYKIAAHWRSKSVLALFK